MQDQTDSNPGKIDLSVVDEVQILLAEKRTALSELRTGIAVLALPMSVIGFLIATSKYYDPTQVMHWLVPLLVINAALVILGTYLIIRTMIRIHRYDRRIRNLKKENKVLEEFID